MVTIGDPWAETPKPSEHWHNLSSGERTADVEHMLALMAFDGKLSCVRALENGEVTLGYVGKWVPSPAVRGRILMDLEKLLKQSLDTAIVVYLAFKEDRNAIRKFRGVKVDE